MIVDCVFYDVVSVWQCINSVIPGCHGLILHHSKSKIVVTQNTVIYHSLTFNSVFTTYLFQGFIVNVIMILELQYTIHNTLMVT